MKYKIVFELPDNETVLSKINTAQVEWAVWGYSGCAHAEPEQKSGTWQRRKGSDCWECSQCHAVLENNDLGMHNFYFCYHCGANMMNKMGYMDIEEVHYE